MKHTPHRNFFWSHALVCVLGLLVVVAASGNGLLPVAEAAGAGATLYVGPVGGTYTVGSTFSVSFYVNTAEQFINVVDADILFPPDKLQVVSPSTGSSFINVWAIQPSYSNTEGTMSFRGAVPSPGISTSAGLISTVLFRVKAVGTATIRFGGRSKVLLNDGLGTDILQQSQNGVYTLVLPPPSGPTVVSQTHPDQSRWYNSPTAALSWAGDAGADGYSFMISREPVDLPDNIVEGARGGVTYANLASGRHYFHIKAIRGGIWGGVTHYAINVDTAAPAEFPIEVSPSARTAQHEPVIKFFTTDAESGLDYYEIKFIPLSGEAKTTQDARSEAPLFTEATSPFIPQALPFGRYDVYVRAYDQAGNFREEARRLEIVPTFFEVVQGQGISIKNIIFIPWAVFWTVMMLALLALGITAHKLHWWHRSLVALRRDGTLPDDVNEKLKQLKAYQQKYGKGIAALFAFIVLIGSMYAAPANAQRQMGVFSPPAITTVSKDIFNDEIFYVGGRAPVPGVEVIIYLQRTLDGQTTSFHVFADAEGSWFYRHTDFLQDGSYVLWAQAQRGDELSPPSPQENMTVAAHAIQVGTSRLSYETVYFITMILLGIIVVILAIAIWYHYHHGKRKHAAYMAEKAKVEESIRRGFALLRRDIEEQARLIQDAKQGRDLTEQEKAREAQILHDLEAVKRHIGEEVWELEKLEETAG